MIKNTSQILHIPISGREENEVSREPREMPKIRQRCVPCRGPKGHVDAHKVWLPGGR